MVDGIRLTCDTRYKEKEKLLTFVTDQNRLIANNISKTDALIEKWSSKMKYTINKILLAGSIAVGLASTAVAGNIQLHLDKYQPRLKVPTPAIQAVVNPNCPNPAVREVRAQVLSTNATHARVRITAVLENTGQAAYRTNPQQQTITLARDNAPVKTQRFGNMNPGGRIFIRYDENVSIRGYGEFTPTFHAYLSYDPDIHIDGNPANDDCRANDNRKSLSGNVVNALLR